MERPRTRTASLEAKTVKECERTARLQLQDRSLDPGSSEEAEEGRGRGL